jgi:hypothetical protein
VKDREEPICQDLRRLMAGALSATAAAGIIYSPLGRISGEVRT